MMKSGLGIRSELFGPIENALPEFGFLEAHSENYFGESIGRAKLLSLREHYPVSLHGVGLSLGRADDLDQRHLAQLKQLVDDVEPMLVSEHLAWSAYSHRHLPDLLPLPLTSQALDIICQHIDQMQTALSRQILIENPSNYLLFEQLQIPEPEFLNELAKRTGCGLLMDVNNIHVSAINVGRDSREYIDSVNSAAIAQYHLAGYTEVTLDKQGGSETVLIDTHNQTVYDPVWALFEHALQLHGVRPTLFEWDSDFPEFSILQTECRKADELLNSYVDAKQASKEVSRLSILVDSPMLSDSQECFLDTLLGLNPELESAIPAHRHRGWIYQNNVFAAIQDYLTEVYPATKGLVGDDFFKQTAELFIQEAPPEFGNIHDYGESFISFCIALESLQTLPYLNDLMVYEWALHSAYFSTVSESLDSASVPQEVLLTAGVQYNDSVTLLSSEYPVYEIHRQSLPSYEGNVGIDLGQSRDQILVCKNGFVVEAQLITCEQMKFMQEISKNENLLQAIEVLQGSIEPDTLSATLSLIFDAKLIKLV
jgi:uncharacterized protein (UPF0276 family)